MERRKKPMKSPFVVTISVAAVAAASLASIACGGKVPTDGVGSSGTSGTSGSSGSSGSSGVIGNPPAPSSCRSGESEAGDPCRASASNECFGLDGAVLVCEESVYVDVRGTNPPPPPPQCPDQAPAEGTPCSSYTPATCAYVDGCEARPPAAPVDKSFVCSAGAWKRTSPSYVAACPAAVPAPGSSCATCAGSYPANCTYPNGSGCPGPTAVCDPSTLTWSVAITSCNPPAVDAGAGP